MNEKEIRYFSMFTGVGGFELGIKQVGTSTKGKRGSESDLSSERNKPNNQIFKCIGFSEYDKFASELLKQKFPGIKNYGDATKIISEELPDFDFLVGGFPCQSFSIAGHRKGFEDTRGTLFFDIARILKIKRPKYILLENVKGLLNHDNGKTFGTILATLSELGYVIQWMVLNSKFFGVPQNRERVFIIGSLRGEPIPEILPIRESNQRYNQESEKQVARTITSQYYKQGQWEQYIKGKVFGTLETDGWEKRHEQIRRVWDSKGTAPTIPTGQGGGVMTKIAINSATLKGYSEAEAGDGIRLEYPESKTARGRVIKGNANTLKSGTEGVIDRSMKIRRLTPTECERLQGFPDDWTKGFSDTQRYKMMGNAVTVPVIKAIMERMFK